MVEVWSCGGGVQSVAIAVLITQGKLPTPDYSVIADTGYERSSTWKYLGFLRTKLPVERVLASQFATVGLWGGRNKDTLLIPAFSSITGSPSKMPGFCSNEWKNRVVARWLRAQGVKKFRLWLGFSTDEAKRAKDHQAYFPLIDLGMSRRDCERVIIDAGWPMPARSSCYMCPNHGADEWLEIRESEDWPKVVEFEAQIRARDPHAWLLRSCKPIKDADVSDPQIDMFKTDCESGVCFT